MFVAVSIKDKCIQNNGVLGGALKSMRAADGKQEINLEWPNCGLCSRATDTMRFKDLHVQ